jgi:alanine racemase
MRSTVAEISKSNLKENLKFIRSLAPNTAVMAIVKANAYGHGILPVSDLLRSEGVEFLGVAFPEEGIRLRQSGDSGPIVVLVPAMAEEAMLFCEYDLQPAVSNMEFVEAMSKAASKLQVQAKLHLFIETGMNREGIYPEDTLKFLEYAKKLPNIEFIGICTHFATSSGDLEYAKLQLSIFNNLLDKLTSASHSFKYIHTSNSGAIANLPEARFNLVRPGMALYGYPPDKSLFGKFDVKPVLTLKSRVALIRRIKAGDTVGYGREFKASKDTSIATIPIGYGDGYFKTLTHKTQCLIAGKFYNMVGTICMDECMVELGDDDVRIGDEVILIGTQGKHSISAYDLSEKIGTIPYEITTAISARVPRIYVD